jgi:DNA-binding GntR family transcriptional regulator
MSGPGTDTGRSLRANEITNLLRDQILSGKLVPGARIVVSEVARANGVSTIPVREALKTLEGEALVQFLPHRGAVVSTLELDELHEVYELRRLLECELARRAVLTYTERDLAALERAWERMSAQAPASDEFWRAHQEFHWTLLRPQLGQWHARLLGMLWQASARFQRIYGSVGNMHQAHRDHAALLRAARTRDGARVKELLSTHLTHTEATLTSHSVADRPAADRPAVRRA